MSQQQAKTAATQPANPQTPKAPSNDATTGTTPTTASEQSKPAVGTTPPNPTDKAIQPASKSVEIPTAEQPKKEAKVQEASEPELAKAIKEATQTKSISDKDLQAETKEFKATVNPTVLAPSLGRTILYTPELSDSIYDPKRQQYPAIVVGLDDVDELIVDLVVFSPSLRSPSVSRLGVQHKSKAKEGQPSWDWPIIKR